MRAFLALGVLLFVAGPATAATASATTAAKKHHHHKVTTTPPPPSGPAVAVSGDLTETAGDGGVGFDFHGAGWFANETIDLSAPGMATACDAAPLGIIQWIGVDLVPTGTDIFDSTASITTDFSGVFNTALAGFECPPGTYQVEAQEVLSPSRVATTEVTITAPKVLTTGVTLSPASEVESGTLGEVAGTLIIGGLNPAEPYTVSSPALNLACSQVPGGAFLGATENNHANIGAGALASPGVTGETDFAATTSWNSPSTAATPARTRST